MRGEAREHPRIHIDSEPPRRKPSDSGMTMLDPVLSLRAGTAVASLNRPWRFAPRATYDPDTNPEGLISFGTAENALVTDELVKFANEHVKLQDKDFLYRGSTGGGPEFKAALAQHVNEYLHPHSPVTENQIEVSGSATTMHDALAWALANRGDKFLTSRPVYGRFELDFFNKSGVKVEYADSHAEDCFDVSVVDKFEEALESAKSRKVNVKAIFIVNPHNPLGQCYPKETLIAIMQLCKKHRLHLISDEIYACSVFESDEPNVVPFTSILSFDTDKYIDPRYLHVTYGLSKDFGAAGLKVGAVITRSQSVREAVNSVSRFHSASAPSLSIGTAMLRDREWCHSFIDANRTKLAKAHAHVTKGLKEMGVQYLPGSNAGFFVWIDLSPYLSEKERFPEFALAENLKKAGVFLHPQEEHSLRPGWFRVVYTQDSRTVTEGLRRIQTAIS